MAGATKKAVAKARVLQQPVCFRKKVGLFRFRLQNQLVAFSKLFDGLAAVRWIALDMAVREGDADPVVVVVEIFVENDDALRLLDVFQADGMTDIMVGLAGGGAGEEVFGFRADIWKQLLLPAFRGGQGVVVVHRAHGEGKAHLLERAGAFDGVRLLLDNIRHDFHPAFQIIFQPCDFFVVRWPAFMAHADFARDLLVR